MLNLERYRQHREGVSSPGPQERTTTATAPGKRVAIASLLEDFAERAGILEYEGGEEHTQAGQQALQMIEKKYLVFLAA